MKVPNFHLLSEDDLEDFLVGYCGERYNQDAIDAAGGVRCTLLVQYNAKTATILLRTNQTTESEYKTQNYKTYRYAMTKGSHSLTL